MANKRSFQSLRLRSDFLDLKETGQVFHVNSWLLVNWKARPNRAVRCGCTISRHIGTAVTRNRLKRWAKDELHRWTKHRAEDAKGFDLNFIFKRRDEGFYRGLKREEFNAALAKVLQRIERSV